MAEETTTAVSDQPLDWTLASPAARDGAVDFTRSASPAELTALAPACAVPEVLSLAATGRARAVAGKSADVDVRLTVRARLRQLCGVTNETYEADLNEDAVCRYGPAAQPALGPSSETEEHGVFELEDYDQLINGRVPLGQLVFETLVAAIDPYPRAPQVAAEDPETWVSGTAGESGQDHPFAALRDLASK
ncbi:MAG: hypothetical protein AAGG72_05665 [Pseudomonadota bacterium]